MARRIVLLRGINLGSRNRVSMPELRSLLSGAGYGGVRTYVQSGNVVLDSDEEPDRVADHCKRLIANALDLDIEVVGRTREELAEVVARNPLAGVASNPKRYQVTFLSEELDPAVVRGLADLAVGPERLVAVGRELYSWHPEGIGRSKLWGRVAARGLGVTATARNWTTVTALLAMADK